jgi:hypothetical protein
LHVVHEARGHAVQRCASAPSAASAVTRPLAPARALPAPGDRIRIGFTSESLGTG